MVGKKCPMGCGWCCGYWREIISLVAYDKAHPRKRRYDTCPHVGDLGCKLPRSMRPVECLSYLCGIAASVLNKSISRRDGLRSLEEGYNCLPDALTRRRRRPSGGE